MRRRPIDAQSPLKFQASFLALEPHEDEELEPHEDEEDEDQGNFISDPPQTARPSPLESQTRRSSSQLVID